jgi:hypothetical protein
MFFVRRHDGYIDIKNENEAHKKASRSSRWLDKIVDKM